MDEVQLLQRWIGPGPDPNEATIASQCSRETRTATMSFDELTEMNTHVGMRGDEVNATHRGRDVE